jgi:hypothetical protein
LKGSAYGKIILTETAGFTPVYQFLSNSRSIKKLMLGETPIAIHASNKLNLVSVLKPPQQLRVQVLNCHPFNSCPEFPR